MLSSEQLRTIQHAVIQVCKKISRTHVCSSVWQESREEDLLVELAACILGSRVSYETAVAAVQHLLSVGLLEPRHVVNDRSGHEERVIEALSQQFFPFNGNPNGQRYPFPFARANHLCRSMEAIYGCGGSLREILINSKEPFVARLNLVSTLTGIGPKQASLFLRNIGYANNLAILDTHVLRYVAWNQIVSDKPTQLRTLESYRRVEEAFCLHAYELGFSVTHLDLAVWVVVRVANKEQFV